MIFTEAITWTLTKDKMPPLTSGDDLAVITMSGDEDGNPVYSVLHGVQYIETDDDNEMNVHYFNIFFKDGFEIGEDGEIVVAWAFEPTGKSVIDRLTRPADKPRNSLIPFESDLS